MPATLASSPGRPAHPCLGHLPMSYGGSQRPAPTLPCLCFISWCHSGVGRGQGPWGIGNISQILQAGSDLPDSPGQPLKGMTGSGLALLHLAPTAQEGKGMWLFSQPLRLGTHLSPGLQ